ncbi:MAG: MBL fold metallo-hydrolase [Thermoplasmata archaeon]|nr:MAG: MBL fold metallo-hydrolase [Thermoplasmata archaeon]
MAAHQLVENLKNIHAEQLDEHLYLIIGKNNGTFPYSNSLLIVDEQTAFIDSGTGLEVLLPIRDHVDFLINSHYHIDHVSGNHLFSELRVFEVEEGVTSSFESYRRYAGILGSPVEKDWLSWFNEYFTFHPSSPTQTFGPDEVFELGDTSWIAVHTPGHSPGHCCFYEPEKKVMFASDIDLSDFGPWYGNPNANLGQFIESIKMISDFDMNMIVTSHTMPLRNNIQEALENYLGVIYERDERILGFLEMEMTVAALEKKNIIYTKRQKRYGAFAWFEENMIQKHLDRLIELHRVVREGDTYRAI